MTSEMTSLSMLQRILSREGVQRFRTIPIGQKAVYIDLPVQRLEYFECWSVRLQSNIPEITLVFDHFHTTKLFNEKLTKLRHDLQREAKIGLDKPVLIGMLWLLLKNPDTQKAL